MANIIFEETQSVCKRCGTKIVKKGPNSKYCKDCSKTRLDYIRELGDVSHKIFGKPSRENVIKDKILSYLKTKPEGDTSSEISFRINEHISSVSRYLTKLETEGKIVHFGYYYMLK